MMDIMIQDENMMKIEQKTNDVIRFNHDIEAVEIILQNARRTLLIEIMRRFLHSVVRLAVSRTSVNELKKRLMCYRQGYHH